MLLASRTSAFILIQSEYPPMTVTYSPIAGLVGTVVIKLDQLSSFRFFFNQVIMSSVLLALLFILWFRKNLGRFGFCLPWHIIRQVDYRLLRCYGCRSHPLLLDSSRFLPRFLWFLSSHFSFICIASSLFICTTGLFFSGFTAGLRETIVVFEPPLDSEPLPVWNSAGLGKKLSPKAFLNHCRDFGVICRSLLSELSPDSNHRLFGAC